MSSEPIADKHRRLADALEAAAAEGIDVDGVESFTVDGELVATVDVGVSALQEDTVDDEREAVTGEELAEAVGECAEPPAEKADVVDANASAVDPADEPAPSIPSESDIAPGDLEGEEDEEDPDEAVERLDEEEAEGCSVDHDELADGEACSDCDYVAPLPQPEDADETEEDGTDEPEAVDEDPSQGPVDDPLAEEVVSILDDEGELLSSDLRDRVDGNRTEFYDAADQLKTAGRVTVRDDPDDGRRKLYSLVESDYESGPEWNGRDPETVVADSSLPARVVLEDILDAVATADTVIDVAEQMDVDVNNLEPVCWYLTLKQPNSLSIVDDVDERVETIRAVVA